MTWTPFDFFDFVDFDGSSNGNNTMDSLKKKIDLTISTEKIPNRDILRFDSLLSEYKKEVIGSNFSLMTYTNNKLDKYSRKELIGKCSCIGIFNGFDGYYYIYLGIIRNVKSKPFLTIKQYYKCDSYEGVESLLSEKDLI